ncbi:hypothetical protein BDY21DRAFT_97591 [Lineolata rhizophorae]|uniref:Phenazine biosynthesis-like protein n=1 Tax=Lineolata rhizophorae TaxID=578093 RepID=A0A6A6NU49_9PEZI|nr:hypothetical protein BDY21DRAFT_97591 [Lineolata rhizophorae]
MASQQLEFTTCDVFTDIRFEGNPLAIVRLPPNIFLSQGQKQAIAKEFNLSETVFLRLGTGQNPDEWTIDIFITDAEIPFAGHPTIGSAWYAFAHLADQHVRRATLNTKAGPIPVTLDPDRRRISASIPHDVIVHKTAVERSQLLDLRPALREVGQAAIPNRAPVVSIVRGMTFALVELGSLDALRAVKPAGQLLRVSLDAADTDLLTKGFVGWYFYVRLAGMEDGTKRLCARMFDDPLEDPATGSAASALAVYRTLRDGEPGKVSRYAITQGVEMGRRSEIGVEVALDEERRIRDVVLSGWAVPVMEGKVWC